ncbi:MAG: aminotransferase class V-fold PLP-dependent enzyme [Geminicoccaceae bacterium]
MSDTLSSARTAMPSPLKSDFDVEAVRAQFPIFDTTMHGRPLVYLDTGASAQKPQRVIERLNRFYAHEYANIHRGVYELSQDATEMHEAARETVRRYLNAAQAHEIIFTRGATEAINLVAQSYGRTNLQAGDAVLISAMEHHANIVPWQLLRDQIGIELRVVPVTSLGELDMDAFDALLDDRVKLVALTWVSNVLGTINPVETVISLAHAKGVPVLLDAAQAVQHMPVDVQALDCDFLVFSGHKTYAPAGIGVLYGKEHLLEAMPPYQGGGDMILSVSFDKTVFNDLPYKFEAGTPDIAGAIALGEALTFLQELGLERIAAYEAELLAYAERAVRQVPGLKVIGEAPAKASVISFTMAGAHPHDIGTLLDLDGIAIRAGHHCAQPIVEQLGDGATARVSLGMYNTTEDIDALVKSLRRVADMFA